jgi:hypothetical protein
VSEEELIQLVKYVKSLKAASTAAPSSVAEAGK